ncbi:MAG: ATP-binding protein [Archangium sp.]|nr:ATP-binding protein [Archangium sp.]
MSEVSCRAFSFFTAAHKAGLISLDELLAGQPLSREVLEDAGNRVPWDQWVTLCDRFAAMLPSEDALCETGSFVLSEGFSGYLGKVVGLFTDAAQIYEVLAKWGGPSLYRSVTFSTDTTQPGVLTFTAELLPGFRPCRSWFLMAEGALTRIPFFAGLPDSLVERVTVTGQGGVWRVRPPASGSLGSSFRRMWTALSAPDAIFNELFAQQVQLQRAFDEMRRSAKTFRNALDALPLLVAVHEEGLLRYANPAFAAFFGRPPAELEGTRLEALFPDSQRALLAAATTTALSLLVNGGATPRQLEACSAGAVEFDGKPATLFFARDVTVEREAEQRATRSEATLEAVIGAFPDLVLRFGRDGTLLSVHGGTSVRETALLTTLVGRTWADVLERFGDSGIEPRRQLVTDLEESMATGLPRERLYQPAAAGGRARELLVRFVPLALGKEVIVITHDQTRQKDVERRLEIAERMASLGSLAAGVAHEINNPLTWVMGNVATLQAQLADGSSKEDVLTLLAEVNDGCARIRDTVGRMRDFSRVQQASQRRVVVAELVDRAARMTHTEVRHRARLELDLTPGLQVLGDPTELGQVIVNLLVNAAQAMPEGAAPERHRIRLRSFAEGERVVIEITDDGAGIRPEHLPRLFDPFFTTRHHAAGTGLGLAISHRIVAAHGGGIEVKSEPGKTTFQVKLPLQPITPEQPVVEATLPVASRRATVLVIDDEPLVGKSISRMLRDHDVVVTADGNEALARLRDGELPDLVLCDLMMPGLTGMELYERLSEVREEVLPRLAFMSGGAFTPGAEQFVNSHPVTVLTKPFDRRTLDALVAQVLATGATASAGR